MRLHIQWRMSWHMLKICHITYYNDVYNDVYNDISSWCITWHITWRLQWHMFMTYYNDVSHDIYLTLFFNAGKSYTVNHDIYWILHCHDDTCHDTCHDMCHHDTSAWHIHDPFSTLSWHAMPYVMPVSNGVICHAICHAGYLSWWHVMWYVIEYVMPTLVCHDTRH